MARIRSIHPDACKSEKLDAISAEAERCYWRLQPHCDDDGRAEDNPRLLRSAMFQAREHLPSAEVDCWLSELEAAGLLVRYVVDGRRYLAITRWSDYQKPQKKVESKLPPLPDSYALAPVALPEHHANGHVALPQGEGVGEGEGGDARNPSGGSERTAPLENVQPLVAGYVDDYRAERQGSDPSSSWRASAGKAIRAALKDGETPEAIGRCLGVIAHEGKNPSTLPNVLADYHAGRPRRP